MTAGRPVRHVAVRGAVRQVLDVHVRLVVPHASVDPRGVPVVVPVDAGGPVPVQVSRVMQARVLRARRTAVAHRGAAMPGGAAAGQVVALLVMLTLMVFTFVVLANVMAPHVMLALVVLLLMMLALVPALDRMAVRDAPMVLAALPPRDLRPRRGAQMPVMGTTASTPHSRM